MIAEVRATELAELDALQLMWTFSRRLATAAAVMTIVSQAAFRQFLVARTWDDFDLFHVFAILFTCSCVIQRFNEYARSK